MKSAVKKRRAKSICSANAIAPGRTSSPRLRAVVSYINDNREVVLEHTAMEIATATQTSDATVVRAIQALASPGCASLADHGALVRHLGHLGGKDALDGYRALQRRQLQY